MLEAEAALGRPTGGSGDADGTPGTAAGPAAHGTRLSPAARALALARRHPLAVLAGVAAIGFLVGRAGRSRTRP